MHKNESINQRIKQKLVDREILMNVNTFIDTLQQHEEEIFEAFCSYDEESDEYTEIFEYYAVTDWLAEKLMGKGEVVANVLDAYKVWGRQTTGQAIALDNVIAEIANDMQILVSQKNDWSKQWKK